jgi:hypothetical protein
MSTFLSFNELSLGTLISINLQAYCKNNGLSFREPGHGTFYDKSNRDSTACWCISSQKGIDYYFYLQVAYTYDSAKGKKISKISSLVMFDFITNSTLAKIHIEDKDDLNKMSDFFKQIDTYLLDN